METRSNSFNINKKGNHLQLPYYISTVIKTILILTWSLLASLLDVVVRLGDLEDSAALLVGRAGSSVTEISEDGVAHLLQPPVLPQLQQLQVKVGLGRGGGAAIALALQVSKVLGSGQQNLCRSIQASLLGDERDVGLLLRRLVLNRTVQHHVPFGMALQETIIFAGFNF